MTPAQLNALPESVKAKNPQLFAAKRKEKGVSRKENSRKSKLPKQTPKGLLHIRNQLILHQVAFVNEYEFAKDRKFRFDIALPDRMIYIEYEGLVATGKKGGHQTKKHYTKDCEKYNLAASLGWTGYRYTAYNFKEISLLINKIKTA